MRCVFLPLAAALLLVGAAGPVRSEEPPAWQRELETLRLAEATVALLPPSRAAERLGTNRRLGELYRQLAAKYPDRPAVRKAAGDHYWLMGETGPAMAEWQAAQALDPADADIARALGSAWLSGGEVRQARAQFQRAVDARPDVATYHFDLANVLYTFRHEMASTPALPDEASAEREALAHFRRASDLAADNVAFAQAYAETFYGMQNPDWSQALVAWNRLKTLNAATPDYANSHLARISLRLGKPEQAEGYLALIHDPAFAQVKAILQRQATEMKHRATGSPGTR